MRKSALIALALGFFIVPLVLNGQSGRNRGGESTTSGPSGKTSNEDRSSDRNPSISNSTAPGNGEPIEGDVIRIDTSLVTVPVTVMDKNGNYVPNLMRGDFHLFDNGIEQTIAYFATIDQPYTVALIIDTSNSTHFRLDDIQDAAIAFVKQLGPEDRVMVVSFDEQINILSEPTSNRFELTMAIRATRTGGGTRLYDAVDLVMKEKLKGVPGRTAIVLFTDGVDTRSRRASYSSTVREAQEQESLVYPIAYDTSREGTKRQLPLPGGRGGIIIGLPSPGARRRGPSGRSKGGGPMGGDGSNSGDYSLGDKYLHDLAQASGGRFYRGDTLHDVSIAFAQVADELRRLYSLGYYPSPPGQPGEFRQIKVSTLQPELVVGFREGYIYTQRKTKD
ncbi:MAG TPA: VWA domain-containing protein [Pyrinomonadaceae bacterium]|nr:VWA domain-containing protein [Pyrinomonadaceae bacterium]